MGFQPFPIRLLSVMIVFSFGCWLTTHQANSQSFTKLKFTNVYAKRSLTKLVSNYMDNHHFNMNQFMRILNSISIERNINSKGHRYVRKFIETTLHHLNPNWHVEEDSFASMTSIGKVQFHNIVATFIPRTELCHDTNDTIERIVLSCHYDSLRSSLINRSDNDLPESKFIAATDAAVPCSMLLIIAQFFTPYLNKIWSRSRRQHNLPTLQLVFFDGEESLSSHDDASKANIDSLFGSRHLAKMWQQTSVNSRTRLRKQQIKWRNHSPIVKKTKRLRRQLKERFRELCQTSSSSSSSSSSSPGQSYRRSVDGANSQIGGNVKWSQGKQDRWPINGVQRSLQTTDGLMRLHNSYHSIDNIRLLILVDLIGGPNPRFFNTNLQTSNYYARLAQIERLVLKQQQTHNGKSVKPFFQTNPPFLLSLVRDDHLPFVKRNVSVIHIIPHPFPRAWHQIEDNLAHLDFNSIRRLTIIFNIFLLDTFNVKL
ncbi:hypothetical protein BLOT_000531 [Blomia tropicalis]|nr:hypothetical protein BLOT_000531 [Blomia tropicalis]